MKALPTTGKGTATSTNRHTSMTSSKADARHIVRREKRRIEASIERYFEKRSPKDAA
jgi:hypothetical protein